MRLTIGKKLNLLIVGVQIITAVSVIGIASHLFTNDLPGILRKTNLDVASLLASRVRTELNIVTDRMRIIGGGSLEDFRAEEDKLRFLEQVINLDSQIFAISLYDISRLPLGGALKETPRWRVVNKENVAKFIPSTSTFDKLDADARMNVDSLYKGKEDVAFVDKIDGHTVIRLAIPFFEETRGIFTQFLVAELNADRFAGLFYEASEFSISMLDSHRRVLSTNDPALKIGASVEPELEKSLSGRPDSQAIQFEFLDQKSELQVASVHPVGVAGLSIVTQAPFSRITAAKNRMFYRTGLLCVAIVCMSVWLAILLSRGPLGSVARLARAAQMVIANNLTVRLPASSGSKYFGKDELEEFSDTFNVMVAGLDERNRVLSAMDKLHGKEMAGRLSQGQLKLGGVQKNCIVFFSDIRNFTPMSEKLAPEHLILILNRYLTAMVKVIERNKGTVTSFIGDGIMAAWGVDTLKAEDSDNAVKACLEMRTALFDLNKELIREGRSPLFIGMGLHFGPVIVGTVGSESRMEFTMIGDTANTAARIESTTKEFGSDLLVSEAVLEKVRTKYVLELVESQLKGKANPITLFKVHGYVDANKKDNLIVTPFSHYQREKMNAAAFQETFLEQPAVLNEETRVTTSHRFISLDDLQDKDSLTSIGTTVFDIGAASRKLTG